MTDERENLEFGPSGYLPERASKRARKIVLRAPLGMHWIWAAVVAGVIVLIAGSIFLLQADSGPAAPFTEVAPLDDLAQGPIEVDGGSARPLLLVTEGGRPRVFDVSDAPDASYCDPSRRLETPDGRVWSLTGRGFGSTPSLDEHPTVVFDGLLYVDPTTTVAGPPATDDVATPAC